jgi:hypothetical protein
MIAVALKPKTTGTLLSSSSRGQRRGQLHAHTAALQQQQWLAKQMVVLSQMTQAA